MINPKLDRSTILAADPKSFNELADLYESFILSLDAPLMKATHSIQDEPQYRYGDILGNIVGVVDDWQLLVEQLKKIRTRHNQGRIVTLCLDRSDTRHIAGALEEITCLLSDTESALGLLQQHLDGTDHAAALSVLALSRRALMSAEESEARTLHKFSATLNEAAKHQPHEEEAA